MVTKKGGSTGSTKGSRSAGKAKLNKTSVSNVSSGTKGGSKKANCGCGSSFTFPPSCASVTGG